MALMKNHSKTPKPPGALDQSAAENEAMNTPSTAKKPGLPASIGLDAVSGEIVASTLTGRDVDDGSQVAALLDQVDGSVGVLMCDGAYDSADVYAAVEERNSDALVIVPRRAGAVAG